MGFNQHKKSKEGEKIRIELTVSVFVILYTITFFYLAIVLSDFLLLILFLNVLALLVIMYLSNKILFDVIDKQEIRNHKDVMAMLEYHEENQKIKKKYYSLLANLKWKKEGDKNVRKAGKRGKRI